MTNPATNDTPVDVRIARVDDAEGMLACVREILAEPGVGLTLEPEEFTQTLDDERELIADLARTNAGAFVIAVAGGEIVGVLNCFTGKQRARRHVGTLGISLRPAYRGRGVGTRMMRAAIDWARQTGVVRRLELTVFATNAAAIRVYEKVGFVVEGRRPGAVFRAGRYQDDFIMGMWLG